MLSLQEVQAWAGPAVAAAVAQAVTSGALALLVHLAVAGVSAVSLCSRTMRELR